MRHVLARFGGGHPQPALFYLTIRVPLRATKDGCRGPATSFFTPPCRFLLKSSERLLKDNLTIE